MRERERERERMFADETDTQAPLRHIVHMLALFSTKMEMLQKHSIFLNFNCFSGNYVYYVYISAIKP